MFNNKIFRHETNKNIKHDALEGMKPVTKTKKQIFKLVLKGVAIFISLFITLSVAETLIVAFWGDIYAEKVLEKRYGDTFEYTGHAGLADYSFKSENFPDREILLYINSSKYSFWNTDKWQDDYLSIKYHSQAEELLLKIATDSFGKGTKIEIDPDKIPGEISKQCDSFDFYMKNLLKYSAIKILTLNPNPERTENTKKFISELKKRDYYLGWFNVFYFDFEEINFNNYNYPGEIYSDAIEREHIVLNEDFSIDEII